MKNPVAFFLERKMFIDILLFSIFILGIISVATSRKEGFPEVRLNKFTIQTIYPGASAKDVEINVTKLIEDELKEVEGIKEIISYSEESSSRIQVQGLENLSKSAVQRLFNDLYNALSRVDDLPDGIKGKPIIHEVATSDVPVLEISFRGEYKILKPFLEELKIQVRKIPGIKNATIIGLPDEELHILVDSQKARRYNLDIRNIANAIQNRNREGTGGIIRTESGERTMVLEGKFKVIEEVLETELLTNDIGYSVKLKDVASIQLIPEDVKLVVRNNGERGAVLAIQKIGSFDLLDTVAAIRKLLDSTPL
ncbi:MAG: efflux RND transporter permease subunit, partial [Leptospira sp.]|nr:efflux RND transporter permease subunit [Leptospira sp.]